MKELQEILQNDKLIYDLRKRFKDINDDLESVFFAHFTETKDGLLQVQEGTLKNIYSFLKVLVNNLETRDFIKENAQ